MYAPYCEQEESLPQSLTRVPAAENACVFPSRPSVIPRVSYVELPGSRQPQRLHGQDEDARRPGRRAPPR